MFTFKTLKPIHLSQGYLKALIKTKVIQNNAVVLFKLQIFIIER